MKITLVGVVVIVGAAVLFVVILDVVGRELNRDKGSEDEQTSNHS